MRKKVTILILMLLISIQCLLASEKPNIIFILADDQGYGDLSCFGSAIIHTPNIDALSKQGMKFTSFYVHNRCSPTRAAFMTGCHAQRVDMGKVIYHRDSSGLNSEEITIAEMLKEAGYATGIVGKWHMGEWPQFNPLNHGFDYFCGLMDDGENGRVIFENYEKIADIDSKNDRYSTSWFQPASIKFIREHKEGPFFLYYASNIPHSKWIPNQAFKGKSIQGAFGDCVQQLDWVVGELTKEIELLGLTDNTLIIYTSDNGPQLNKDGHGSSGELRDGKWTDFEGGIRVPCIMRWPGKIPAGTTNNEITGIIDMLPTFCELAGTGIPHDRIIDGESITPYMFDQNVDEPIHETFIVPGTTIRYGDWKLLLKEQKPGGAGNEGDNTRTSARAGSLFNLREDIGETKDISGDYPEKAATLKKMMESYMESFNENVAYHTLFNQFENQDLANSPNLVNFVENFHKKTMWWVGPAPLESGHPWTELGGPTLDPVKLKGISAEWAKLNLSKWHAMKMWEMMNTFDAQDKAQSINPLAESYQWPSNQFSTYQIAAHFIGDNRGTSAFGWETLPVGTYYSSIWYELQMVLNSGMRTSNSVQPVDWAYNHYHINRLGERTGIYEPLRLIRNIIKGWQMRDTPGKTTIDIDTWTLREVSPWRLYSNFRGDTTTYSYLNKYEPGLRTRITTSMLESWLKKSNEYPVSAWPRTNEIGFGSDYCYHLEYADYDPTGKQNPGSGLGKLFAPDGAFDAVEAHAFWRMIPLFKADGVDPQVVEDLARWANTIWTNPNTDWEQWYMGGSGKKAKPNIVVFLADDLGYGSTGVYGANQNVVQTPSIDRLAEEGRVFTNAYTPSSVCSPTRYGLLTGRYDWRTGQEYGVLGVRSSLHINSDRPTVATMLKKSGYNTAAIGKWHLGYQEGTTDYYKPLSSGPLDLGFDYHWGVPTNHGDIAGVWIENEHVFGLVDNMEDLPVEQRQPEYNSSGKKMLGIPAPYRTETMEMTVITEKAVDWIRDQSEEKPFFLYVAQSAIHAPIVTSPNFEGTSGGGAYGDFIQELDFSVGEVLRVLDSCGFRDNTLVLFTSDNGGHPSGGKEAIDAGLTINGDLRGTKLTIWEGGFKVPYIVCWPDSISPGTSCDELVSLVDTYSSIANLVGGEFPDKEVAAEDSYNALPAWLGQEIDTTFRGGMVQTSFEGITALRNGKWKYIEGIVAAPDGLPGGRLEEANEMLYDLSADPTELNNVLNIYPEISSEMKDLLSQIRSQGYSRTD